jgi:MerR family transcriptional regulator, copper efflux regulator
MTSLTIGRVAARAGLSPEALRSYERQGLLDKPTRRKSGYRGYGEEVFVRLEFIKRAKGLGFSLREIKEFLELQPDSTTTCGDVRQLVARKIVDIESRIEALERMRRALGKVAECCSEAPSQGPCPFIQAFEAEEGSAGVAGGDRRGE